MKKINSIGYGHKIVGLAGCLLLLAPPLGCIALLSLAVLLGIEFHQDRAIDRQYDAVRKTKTALGSGAYECQRCGNRTVTGSDRYCNICGMTFTPERSNPL